MSLVVACERFRSSNGPEGGGLVMLQNCNTSTSSLINCRQEPRHHLLYSLLFSV
uniref:Uncharacterized protein n=1 Tax=Physcomitrium patens TaxID=3218 RepID=A0A2K1JLY7_PHYPA|nr:hypothetical protein PHYPA_017393 [Physcomitrium patens]